MPTERPAPAQGGGSHTTVSRPAVHDPRPPVPARARRCPPVPARARRCPPGSVGGSVRSDAEAPV